MPQLTKRDIEASLTTKGDYVKMDFLNRSLKQAIDLDTKKFILIKLSGIYEARGMFSEAARLYRNIADINPLIQNKVSDLTKSGELFIKSGRFQEADFSFERANTLANSLQKVEIKNAIKEFYKVQAKSYLLKDKRKHALDTYEKLLTLSLTPEEKLYTQQQLLKLYEKLGKVREYLNLKEKL